MSAIRTRFLPQSALTVCICALACILASGPALALTVGSDAPSFEVTTLEGEKVSLQGYAGQGPVLVFFWTTWCRYCQKEIPAIQSLMEEYGPEGLQVLGINTGWRDSEQRAESFRRRHQVQLPLAFDHSSDIAAQYRVQGVPTLFLLDNDSTVRYRGYGINSELRDILDRMLTDG